MSQILPRLSIAVFACLTLRAADYDLTASPSTIVWGYYSAQAKPARTVHSGDSVRMHTVSTCPLERMEQQGVPHDAIPHCDRDIHQQVTEKGPGGLGPHLMKVAPRF